MALRALIFDCDGTLAETEEAHRAAFNRAFADAGLDWHWSIDRYRDLLKVTGGRERIAHYIAQERLLAVDIPALHKVKNEIYAQLVTAGEVALRPGVLGLMQEAEASGMALAIATTTSRANLDRLIAATPLSAIHLAAVATGEDVRRKKPDPEVFLKTLALLDIPASDCIAIEDSENGLRAACGAGIKTVITPSFYSSGEDFREAALLVPDLDQIDGLSELVSLTATPARTR